MSDVYDDLARLEQECDGLRAALLDELITEANRRLWAGVTSLELFRNELVKRRSALAEDTIQHLKKAPKKGPGCADGN